ncbi:hypothetical protein FRC09_007767 [Ceratobasidium sp. 395]|nr:hypothetical protein FRC09_007767 [Ceratobasidium sp. 395]
MTNTCAQASRNKATNQVSHSLDAPGGPAPHVPPPNPPTERPPVPESAAVRKRRNAKAKQAATETDTTSQEPANESGQQSEPEQTGSARHEPKQPNPDSRNTELRPAHSSDPSSAASELPAIRPNPPTPTADSLAAMPEHTNILTTASLEQGHEFTSLIPTSNNPPFSTPRQANHAPIGFATPALFILGNQPNWTQANNNTDAQFPAPFVPNHSIPFDTTFLNNISPQRPGSMQAPFGNYGYGNTEFADPRPGPSATETGSVVGPIQPNTAQDIFHLNSVPIVAPAWNYNLLYTTVMGTMPTFLPPAPIAPSSSNISHSSGHPTWGESSALRDDPVPAQATSALRISFVPPDMASRHQDSHESLLAPQTTRHSSSHAPTYAPSAPPRPNSLRQGDFTYDQVVAIKHMRHRYQWYLVTEDLFPINVFTARERCILHAEDVLGASRTVYNINNTVFDFVRGKEAGIRHGFTVGLLKIVEKGYQVNPSTGSKLATLIQDSNFTKKVAGRFLHPCIGAVVKNLLFTKQTQGWPLGVRFICDLMMGEESPTSQSGSSDSPPVGVGAPVPLNAFACTLILHALQAIKLGDTSDRNKKLTKPLKLRESKYGGPYRTILAQIEKYHRLEELRKTHMAQIMEQFLEAQSAGKNNSEEEVGFDKEMVSDGE